jgi:hypothetical protein
MFTVVRDGAKLWLVGIAAGVMLLGIMSWSATQPTLHYSLAATCTGYGNSQADCQSQAGDTGAVQAASTGMPNTGKEDLVRDALIGADLVLLGATTLVASRRRRSKRAAVRQRR